MSRVLRSAFRYSIPVLLGYLAIGFAFGLMLSAKGYPAWLALAMSVVIYAGAGQYAAVGLFAAGTGLIESALIILVINIRHLAYGFSLLKRIRGLPWYRWYIVFALTDETFALLSSMPEGEESLVREADRGRFMLILSALDHAYWVVGSVIGALVGSILPFPLDGVEYALTALFIVLMIEQILRIKRSAPFAIAALVSLLAVFFVPARFSLLSAIALSLLCVAVFDRPRAPRSPGREGGQPC